MLALATGWTPDVIADIGSRFRAGCHWALYAQAIAGPEGLPSGQIPLSARPEVKVDLLRQKQAVDKLRTLLFPEGDDG